MISGKVMIIHLISGLIKKRHSIDILYKMIQFFAKKYGRNGGNVKLELDLSNYATKSDSKGAAGAGSSN